MIRRTVALLFLVLLATGTFLTGCGEETVEPTDVRPRVIFLHAAPTAAAQDIDVLVEETAVAVDRSFGDLTTYLAVQPGLRNVSLAPTGTTTAAYEELYQLDEEKNYTLMAINNTDDAISTLLFRDDLTAPSSGTALVRVAHLINDGPKLRVGLAGTGNRLYDSIAFAQNTEFFNEVDAGTYSMRFIDIGENGNGGQQGGADALIEQQITLEAGKIYTFAAIGTAADPDLITITHN